MITLTQGNLLDCPADALVNTVNCVGVMGKGIALQFKRLYPKNFREYERACKAGFVEPGRMLTVEIGEFTGPRFIINFPTKRHWKGKSRIEDIASGLVALRVEIVRLGVRSVAVPPLGCGNGGLDWREVRPMIESALADLDVDIMLFAPEGAPAPAAMATRSENPGLTRARALLVRLLGLYHEPGYEASKLEIQKLAYFTQVAGEKGLQLRYSAGEYGPFAPNLDHVLERLEGHYIRGLGDKSERSEIVVLDGADDEAKALLSESPEAIDRLNQVHQLISGYETPYGMELLATVHWVAQQTAAARDYAEAAVVGVHDWSPRKRRLFKRAHIERAWERLKSQGWLDAGVTGSTEASRAAH